MEDMNMTQTATPETPVPAPAPEPAATPQEPVASTEAQQVNTEPRYVLKTNENTGRRELVLENGPTENAEAPAQENQQPEQPVAEEQQPAQEQPTMDEQVQQAYQNVAPDAVPAYDLQEFSHALATNSIDERRVPEQFREKYIDYTIKKAQQDYDNYIAEQNRQREQVEQQLNQKPDPEKQREFFTKLNEEAKSRALADLGMSEEDYRAKEFEDEALVDRFEAARDWHRSTLISELQARARNEEAVRTQQADMIGQIKSYVQEQRAKEPHFDEIDKMMGNLYQELPYNKAVPIAEAIQAMRSNSLKQDQLGILQEYFQIGREMFYAKKNGLKPQAVAQPVKQQPPVVEKPGSGESVTPPPSVTEKDMRNAKNARERNSILYELLKNSIKR